MSRGLGSKGLGGFTILKMLHGTRWPVEKWAKMMQQSVEMITLVDYETIGNRKTLCEPLLHRPYYPPLQDRQAYGLKNNTRMTRFCDPT